MAATATAKPGIHWGGPPPRAGSKVLKGVLLGLTITVGVVAAIGSFVPGLNIFSTTGAAVTTHALDRVSNSVDKGDEQKFRAEYYSEQIFRQLGVVPQAGQKATLADFKLAAGMNPQIAKLYNAPVNKAADENRSSLFMNGAMIAASPIMGAVGLGQAAVAGKVAMEASKAVTIAKGAAHMIGLFGSVAAGGAIAKVLDNKVVDPQQLIEAVHLAMAQAREKGIDPRQALTPELVFMVRVAQDTKFGEEIKNNFGGGNKGFHQLDPDVQKLVMSNYPALTNAATSEAHAIATGIMPVQELGAMAPNLDSRAAEYARGSANGSFASRVGARGLVRRCANGSRASGGTRQARA